MMKPLFEEKADLVLGSRFLEHIEEMPLIKALGNKIFTWLVRRLTGSASAHLIETLQQNRVTGIYDPDEFSKELEFRAIGLPKRTSLKILLSIAMG